MWSLQGARDVIGPRLREAGNSRGRWGNGGVVGSGQEASGSQAGASSIRMPPTTAPTPGPVGPSQSRLPPGSALTLHAKSRLGHVTPRTTPIPALP